MKIYWKIKVIESDRQRLKDKKSRHVQDMLKLQDMLIN